MNGDYHRPEPAANPRSTQSVLITPMAATSATTSDFPATAASAPCTSRQRVGKLLSRVIVPGWLLAGALWKLSERDPRLLPKPVMDVIASLNEATVGYSREEYLGPALRIIIAAEVAMALMMFFSPRFSRFLGISVMGLFVVILTMLVSSGAASCGCFGKSGPPPVMMLSIDGLLLLGLLVCAPRRSAQSWPKALGVAGASIMVGAGVAFSVPEHTQISLSDPPGPVTGDEPKGPPKDTQKDPPKSAPTTPPAGTTPAPPPVVPPADPPTIPSPNPPTAQTPPATAAKAWPPSPASAKPWYAPEFDKWLGQRLDAQELALLVTRPLPLNPNEGRLHIVFIREDCDHCHALLTNYFSGTLPAPTLVVVVPDATGEILENPCTDCKRAELPKGTPPDRLITYVFTTPALLTVQDGVVVGVCTEVDSPEKVRAALNAGAPKK